MGGIINLDAVSLAQGSLHLLSFMGLHVLHVVSMQFPGFAFFPFLRGLPLGNVFLGQPPVFRSIIKWSIWPYIVHTWLDVPIYIYVYTCIYGNNRNPLQTEIKARIP